MQTDERHRRGKTSKIRVVTQSVTKAAVTTALRAWLVMLALGDIHDTAPAIPAIGYWACVLSTQAIVQMRNSQKRGQPIPTGTPRA